MTMQDVYTYEELPQLVAAHQSEPPVKLGVIGHPIAHSKSPQMQQAALDAAGIRSGYIRILCDTEPGKFDTMLQRLAEQGFIGVNVTVPFKRAAFSACTHTDDLAALSQAVNTLVRCPDGWHGYNTDGPGFACAVRELTGCELADLRVLILGACGGAGSALACQCALSGTPHLTLVNRPKPALSQLQNLLAGRSTGNVIACTFDTPALAQHIRHADLIVNATSLGLHEGDPLPIPASWIPSTSCLYDIVTHDTPLRREATARGCKAANGLGMLLWQGALAFQHWFGILPEIEPMRRALLNPQA